MKECYCGKESSANFTWCEDCLARNREATDALFKVCCDSHRSGAGGARICICGAGCGGSRACNGLYLLQSALKYGGKQKDDVMRLFGWYE
jgi:hypothetical protein